MQRINPRESRLEKQEENENKSAGKDMKQKEGLDQKDPADGEEKKGKRKSKSPSIKYNCNGNS